MRSRIALKPIQRHSGGVVGRVLECRNGGQRMLYYKFWLESRMRFLIAVSVMTLYCTLIMPLHLLSALHHPHPRIPMSYIMLVEMNVYSNAPLVIFLVFAVLLGLCGPSRERSKGTAAVTLALPVSRSSLVATSAIVGLTQTCVLALLPTLSIICVSAFLHRHYPISQALQFALLWIPCGSLCFSIAFVSSSIIKDDSVVQTAVIGFFLLYFLLALSPLVPAPINLLRIMSGDQMPYFSRDSGLLLINELPWRLLSVLLLFSTASLMGSGQLAKRQDF
jgi:ABC-2 type transport system permease protein